MMTKGELKTLVSEGNARQAIQSLLVSAQALGDNELLNLVTIQSSRQEQAERTKLLNTTHPDEVRREFANVEVALLSIVDQLTEEGRLKPNAVIAGNPPAPKGNTSSIGDQNKNTVVLQEKDINTGGGDFTINMS
ncbi:MAG: hypothetical protein IPM82_07725 [Saprospiraceae bacterium]|nr:hypothetical protein [Saprospiraceae bacterium]